MINLLRTVILLLCTSGTMAQVVPAEGSTLNYTLAGFSVPAVENAKSYAFQVAEGYYKEEKGFQKNIIIDKSDDKSNVLIQLPRFGADYTWRVIYVKGGKSVKSKLFHLATTMSRYADTTKYRLRTISNNYNDSALFFFLDNARCLYNIKGKPVWFLPDIATILDSNSNVRDLKFSPKGTITFLTDTGAYEIDYNANILWRALKPEVGKAEKKDRFFHHEFTRLSNGNYLILGTESNLRKVPPIDSAILESEVDVVKKGEDYYKKVDFGTILIFDSSGRLVWRWRASEYFTDPDLFSHRSPTGMFNTVTHMNGCYFDEANSVIYTGFHGKNRIVKIRYPDGKVLAEYGDGPNSVGNNKFRKQHSYSINNEGNLYIFNNNVENTADDAMSLVMVFKEPERVGDTLAVLWQFSCNIDSEAPAAGVRMGNAVQLNDGSYIVCMGTSQRLFIINKAKDVMMNMVSERWNSSAGIWEAFPQYRTSIIYSAQLKNTNLNE